MPCGGSALRAEFLVWLLPAGLLLMGGCSGGDWDRRRSDVGALLPLLDAVHRAPAPKRGPAVAVLAAAAPVTADGRKLRDACVLGYQRWVRTLERLDRVQAATARQERGPALLGELEGAEAELKRARDEVLRCSELQGELERELRLR